MLEFADARLHQSLGVLSRVVIGILPDVAELPRATKALAHLLPAGGGELLKLLLHPLERFDADYDLFRITHTPRLSFAAPGGHVIGGLNELTLAEARGGLDNRSIDPVDLVSDCLDSIAASDPALQAWVTIDREGALKQAAALRNQEPRGPVWGIPFAIKDIIDVAGLPTTGGSKILAGSIAAMDAPVVTALRDGGAVILGKTNAHEFAFGVTTPPTRNPWDPARIPGGSSGGSAVAVATSGCLGALGTDTAGSIRIPSALCGVCGLKPRPGLIPIEGVIPLAPAFDVVGPIARTAEDLALIWQALLGGDGHIDSARFRLALPYQGMLPELEPEVEKAFAGAVEVLKTLAVSSEEVDREVPGFHEFDFPRSVVLMLEALDVHRSRGWWPERANDYTEETRSYLENASTWLTESDDGAAGQRQICRELGQRFASFLERCDLLVTPALPRAAPTHEEAAIVDEGSPRRPVVIELTRLPAAANVAGLAALTVPCGFTSDGLPIGLQLIGNDERLLLGAGIAYQRETDWHTRRPPGFRISQP